MHCDATCVGGDRHRYTVVIVEASTSVQHSASLCTSCGASAPACIVAFGQVQGTDLNTTDRSLTNDA